MQASFFVATHMDIAVITECQDSILAIASDIRSKAKVGDRIGFVSGNFNVIHPGHLRLLSFAAECADYLVVAVTPDGSADIFVPEQFRLEGVQAITVVDYAFILPSSVEAFIAHLQPDVVVKGKEHELLYNSEQEIVNLYKGTLIFAAGETWFSYLDYLQKEMQRVSLPLIKKPLPYLDRHGIDNRKLFKVIQDFSKLNVVVLGDLIIDEYIFCDPLGMSQEDPTIVVTPVKQDSFLGGAGIVAAHAKGMGANVTFFSVVGDDEAAYFSRQKLKEYDVAYRLVVDENRPTTVKRRFRCQGKTLLRVSELRQHNITHELQKEMLHELRDILSEADLVVFSDFNYGCLPQELVNDVMQLCKLNNIPMVADSQSSSQVGDVSRFMDMMLITPTEREARLALQDTSTGLAALAEKLRDKANAEHVFITLGSEGLLAYSPDSAVNEVHTDEVPVLNLDPKDLSGAGDCLLICSAMALVSGATIWESAYLGSIAAACQVSRIGNLPLLHEELTKELLS